MKFKIKDYLFPAVCYSLYICKQGISPSEYLQICDTFRYYCKKTDVSWLAVYSTTKSEDAVQVVLHTGKRGRPRKIIQGEKELGHVHTAIIGNADQSAYSACHSIKQSLDKKYDRKICKVVSNGNNEHAYSWVNYLYKQADIKRSGGDFDFADRLAKHNYFSKKS